MLRRDFGPGLMGFIQWVMYATGCVVWGLAFIAFAVWLGGKL